MFQERCGHTRFERRGTGRGYGIGKAFVLLGGAMMMAGMVVLAAGESLAQTPTAGAWAWKPIVTQAGVRVDYLFYARADNYNNGVVIKLTNTNGYPVAFRFTIVFRAEGAEEEAYVEGRLAAYEVRTGDTAGLFWVPFKDGRSLREVGLRGLRIRPLDENDG
ncbi:MAG: hypothetical protein KatS3mg042_1432 [Rhodothermaceae bacterium]|nr:MAG: hypothetical protein KatS3mg042_1432 [Rhodothermaceae bacterium]